MGVKLFKPFVSWRSVWNAVRVLRSGQLAEGPEVRAFETEFASAFGFDPKKVVAVNSGTSALELAYDLAGIGKGDEVIVPVLTCTATNVPLVRRGAKLVFADVDTDLNASVKDIEKKVTEKTRAIVFVHFGGNSRGLGEVLSLGAKLGIPVIEDAAQSAGADGWGRGDYTCVSLQAIKTLTAGDGGVLVCKRRPDAVRARRLRWFGYDRELKQKSHDAPLREAGYKFHMNDIAAAIARGNLRSLGKLVAHRRKLGEIYRSYGLFAHAWLAGFVSQNHARIRAELSRLGYETGQHHYRNDRYEVFRGARRGRLRNMDRLEHLYWFVPMHHGVSEAQAHEIGRTYAEIENQKGN